MKSVGQTFALEAPTPAPTILDKNQSKLNRPINPSHQKTPTHENLDQHNNSTESSDRLQKSSRSPPRGKTNSDQNCPILIRQTSSTQQIIPTHEVSDQNNNYTAHLDQLKTSGRHPTKKNGVLTNPPLPNDHLTSFNNHRDHFPPLTSNFMSQNRKIQKTTTIDNMSMLPARQNATMAQNPVPSIQQLNSKFNPFHQQPAQTAQPNIVQSSGSNAVHNVRNVPPPTAPNIIPSYAARLKASQHVEETHIEIHSPMITTKQGLPAVLFNKEDFMVKLASNCRFTLIGKFSNTMPKMEVIRKSLTSQLQIKATCKVTHFNSTHVYIDLDNEIDHSTVWNKERIYIEGRLMRLLVWTPNFTPQIETTIAPVWVVLPELPWHCYTVPFVTKLLEPIGRVLFFDVASIQKTRGSVAKVKVEIDITKPRPPHLWLGFPQEEGDVYGDGRWQELQFESIPDYCNHCKRQGHSFHHCKVRIREEEYQKRRKDQEEKDKDQNPIQNTMNDQQRYQPEPPSQKVNKTTYVRVQTSNAPVNSMSNTKVAGPNQWQTQKKKAIKGTKNQHQNVQSGDDATRHQGDQPTIIIAENQGFVTAPDAVQIPVPLQGSAGTQLVCKLQNARTDSGVTNKKDQMLEQDNTYAAVQGENYAASANASFDLQGLRFGVVDEVTRLSDAVNKHQSDTEQLCCTVWHPKSAMQNNTDVVHVINEGVNAISGELTAEDNREFPIVAVEHGIQQPINELVAVTGNVGRNDLPVNATPLYSSSGQIARFSQEPIHSPGNHSTVAAETSKSLENVVADGTQTLSVDGTTKEWVLKSFYGIRQEGDTSVTHIPNNAKAHEFRSPGIEMLAQYSEPAAGNQLVPPIELQTHAPAVKQIQMSPIATATILQSADTLTDGNQYAIHPAINSVSGTVIPADKHAKNIGLTGTGTKSEHLHSTATGGKFGKITSTTGEKNNKRSGKKAVKSVQQTEEEILKAEKMAFWDAILAKSNAENPVIESNIEPLNVRENKATVSIPSQDNFEPANIMPLGSDDDEIESNNALTAYVSPAHSGNTLIPTATLEVMCKQASKVMKEVGRGFFPVTPQDRIDTETQEAPTYYLGDLFEESQKDQRKLSKEVKSKWNLDAPLYIPNALRQQETQVPVESVDSQDASAHEFPTGPSDEVLLQRMDLHDIRGLLHRQNSPPHDLTQKFSTPHPDIIEDGSEYEDEDEDSTAYNKMAEARYAGLSPRFEQAVKPKLIKKKRRPLEIPKKREAAPKNPKRVQPTRSSKSRSSRRK